MDDNVYEGIRRGWRVLLGMPGIRVAWLGLRPAYDPTFAAEMDRLREEVPVTRGAPAADFNRAIAAEVA